MNKKQLIELIKSKIKPIDSQLDEIYQLFLVEEPDCFDFAHELLLKRKNLVDAVDSLIDSYEMWLYDLDMDENLLHNFLETTQKYMSESFFAALT